MKIVIPLVFFMVLSANGQELQPMPDMSSARVSTAREAEILIMGKILAEGAGFSATESVVSKLSFTLGAPIPPFGKKGDRVWQVHRESFGITTGVMWVNAETEAVLIVFPDESRTDEKQGALLGLIEAAQAVVVVEILSTDYSATPLDGPMSAEAKILKVLKGPLKEGARITFRETAWVSPTYREGEYRILFLGELTRRGLFRENHWWILQHLYAKADFFIEEESIPYLSLESLEAFLRKVEESGEWTGKFIFEKSLVE